MKNKIAVIMALLIVIFLTACSKGTGNSAENYFSEVYQVKNDTDGEVSAFGLPIAPADEMDDWVTE